MWSVWINADGYEQKVTWPPLSLTGVLVLGQEQDVLDGGYTKEQSFLGELTGLTLWPVTLTSSEISAWTTCKLPDANPLLEWNNISWISHNLTGEIKLHHEEMTGIEEEKKEGEMNGIEEGEDDDYKMTGVEEEDKMTIIKEDDDDKMAKH
ncbi:hypothetical protein O3P69_009807 [Scylla paramamosain]|uniref:Pentraxin (PTX) domain-containing protein n=1 Tax=Scylla paramamosain TaxID=85552 RepID=A0AAW0SMU8_SCYPA